MLMHDVFGKAVTADQKARLRALKDLDESAAALAEVCRLILDPELPDKSLRKKVFAKIPRAALENALEQVTALIRPPDDVYYQELSGHYRSVRGYLPHVLNHVASRRDDCRSAFAARTFTRPANGASRLNRLTKDGLFHARRYVLVDFRS
jgi:hypothetical protein